jgi:threonine synthase
LLYLTTRDKNDAYTAFRTLGSDRAPDGGLFVPFQLPVLSEEQIAALADKSFSQNVADTLNIFFNARLDSWDIDFCIGRYSTKLVPMSHRILIAEAWHNPDWDFTRIVRNLTSRIRGTEDNTDPPTNWAWIAVRISVIFAVFGEMMRLGIAGVSQPVDIAMPSGDFAGPMAAWYARQMGLPIANIICSCDENGAAWDLLHQGQLQPGAGVEIPSDLERLVLGTLGLQEAKRFVDRMENKRTYAPPEGTLEQLRQGMFAAVISNYRRETIIRNVYQTSTYILDPGSAMAYGGLQDFRASGMETRPALIFTERSPICSADTVAKAMNITVETLKERLNFA